MRPPRVGAITTVTCGHQTPARGTTLGRGKAMRLNVIGYNQLLDFHRCEDADDNTRPSLRVDLMIEGPPDVRPDDYVGRVVEVEDLYPYSYIAQGIRFVAKPEGKP